MKKFIIIIILLSSKFILCQNESISSVEQSNIVNLTSKQNKIELAKKDDANKKVDFNVFADMANEWFNKFVKDLSREGKKLVAQYLYYRKLSYDDKTDTATHGEYFALRQIVIEQDAIWKIFEQAFKDSAVAEAINEASKIIKNSKNPIETIIAFYQRVLISFPANTQIEIGFDSGNLLPNIQEIAQKLENRIAKLINHIKAIKSAQKS